MQSINRLNKSIIDLGDYAKELERKNARLEQQNKNYEKALVKLAREKENKKLIRN